MPTLLQLHMEPSPEYNMRFHVKKYTTDFCFGNGMKRPANKKILKYEGHEDIIPFSGSIFVKQKLGT